MQKKPVALIILDGFGYSTETKHNAIAQAHMPHVNNWLENFPHAFLHASGHYVGLLDEMPGNSLVGHLIIGAGHIVAQPIAALINAVRDGSFFKNQMLIDHFNELAKTKGTLHLMGLLSDGASHSHIEYVHALIRMAYAQGIRKIVLHAFLDGRDVPPQSAATYLEQIEQLFKGIGCGIIGSLQGRAYAMDRNNRTDLVAQSFNVLTQPQTNSQVSWQTVLQQNYAHHITDEFIPPTQLMPNAYIHKGDGLIFFNIRADRARELTALFLYNATLKPAWIITGVPYFGVNEDTNSTDIQAPTLFSPEKPKNTLLDVLEQAKKTIFTIAEQEKYAHVTYFLSGGKEALRAHETRVIIPSYNHEQLIDHPEMSAEKITQAVLASLHNNPADFYVINYANADMIGHTGNFEATVQAVQCLDTQLEKLYAQIVDTMDGTIYLTADHGKAEQMFNETTNQPKTSHTTNLVPFIVIQKNYLQQTNKKLPLTQLADIAPFILSQMNIPLPPEME